MTKVARLYHVRGLRQAEIAERLLLSQSRVSRLLSAAEAAGIVRTVVVTPPGLNSEVEDRLEETFGLPEAHVVDIVAADDDELLTDLGHVTASILAGSPLRVGTIGYTSWSRTLRHCVEVLVPQTSRADRVVELLGDLGPPALQHQAAQSTERLAALTGAEPLYLRVPGILPSSALREAFVDQDTHARKTLHAMDDLDVALVGIGGCRPVAALAGAGFFSEEQFAQARAVGAVGEVCLRFIDAAGELVATPLDDLVLGVSADQLRAAGRRYAVAGGEDKHDAVLAALRGRWVDTLVTDTETARVVLAAGPA